MELTTILIGIAFAMGATAIAISGRPQSPKVGETSCPRCSDADELNAVEKERMFFEFLEKSHQQSLDAVHSTMETMLVGRRDADDAIKKEMAIRMDMEKEMMRNELQAIDLQHQRELRHLKELHHIQWQMSKGKGKGKAPGSDL